MDEYTAVPAQWFDGTTAVRHTGGATWEGETLQLEPYSGEPLTVPGGELRFAETRPGQIVLAREGSAGFRLILPADLPPGFRARLPAASRYGGWIDRFGLWRASLVFGAVSAALVAAFVTAPDWLGPRVPSAWEREIGDAMVGDIDRRVCRTPASDAALAKLLDKLDPGTPQVRAGIANIDMVNAVALPGERVLLFDGIVQQAKSPEELAGVLAHEIGHVRERHVMTAMMRQFGLSILLAGADSGLASNVAGIATLGYSRAAEREADDYARARLAASDVSPLGAAGFFERMAKDAREEDTPAVVGWIASHPSSRTRARDFRAAARKDRPYPPVLTAAEFAALKSACRQDRQVEDWELF